jgi:tetratricopeptide (TPR) repeat protein
MRYTSKRINRSFASLMALFFLLLAFVPRVCAQETKPTPLPPPSGRVNDRAGVIEGSVKERLENMLANLKQRGAIEFAVVTVKSTEGQKIYDYSLELAREWKIGAMQSKDRSLLLVISTDNGEFIAQVSRSLRGEMPDGLIGEMGNRMRAPISSGNYSEALMTAVQTFITQVAERRGFSVEGIEQAQAIAAEPPQQVAESGATATPKESPAEADAAKATSTKTSTARPRSVREVFTKETAPKEPTTKTIIVSRDAPEKTELDALLPLPPAERIEKLKAFIEAHPRSVLKTFAEELLVSAYASLGDEKLRAGDAVGGVEQFGEAINRSPEKISDAFFVKVISQLPINLYMRGQRTASLDATRLIEAKVKDDPRRLLTLAGFYLSIEEADEAARVSERAIQLQPLMAEAHQALGASRHIALRLDEAATEYARALELDPKLTTARRSLADLRRATGKSEEALALYREQLAADPTDKPARAGLVISLLDLGKKEEAERELETALKMDASNLPLLVGASYWFAAKNEPVRAEELATRAIEIEPRYTWAHIALARSLVAQKRPLEAERVLRFARAYGRFPTLDYELASVLAAIGLYEEAATELARSFTIKDGQIETRLAGRTPAHNASFIELLAPERRAGIFQPAVADTEANARMLKGLLALTTLLNASEGKGGSLDPALFASAQQDFLSGEDGTLAFRQLYAASRLLQSGVELSKVVELSEAASSGVEAALDAPASSVGVMADELRDVRAQALASGGTLAVGDVQRSVLSRIMRGHIEDLIGWSLFNQDKQSEALTHLRRAISVLPENSAWWRKAQWHLGATLEATGSQQEALAAYLKSYNPYAPDPVRRVIIETLYRKVNGSLEGLDAKIGPSRSVSSNTSGNAGASTTSQPTQSTTPAATETPQPSTPSPTPEPPATPPSTSEAAPQTAPPATEQPKTESTEQKPVEGKHPIKQP